MAFKVTPTPNLGTSERGLLARLFQVLSEHAVAINRGVAADGSDALSGPLRLAGYNVADLPDPSDHPHGVVYVPDEAGGPTVAVSDGTDWLRVSDNAVVS